MLISRRRPRGQLEICHRTSCPGFHGRYL